MFHNWQQILKTILEDGPENTRQQGCCLTVASSSPFHSRCMLHSAPHWGSGISTRLCFPFFKKIFMSKRQGLRSASQLWLSELTDQESGIWAKGKMWVVVMGSGHQGFPMYPQSTVWGFGHQCCLYCVLYRTKWWSLLEEVLGEPGSLGHFMSTASVRTEDGHSIFLFSPPPSWAKSISRVDKVFLQWSHGEAWQRWGSWNRHADSQVTWKYGQLCVDTRWQETAGILHLLWAWDYNNHPLLFCLNTCLSLA